MNEAVVFSQPLDLLVISGSGLKVGVVSQKIPARKKNPPFQNPRSTPALQQTLATLETGVARTVRQSPVIAPDLHPFHIHHRRYVRSMALLMICAKLLISFNGRGITW